MMINNEYFINTSLNVEVFEEIEYEECQTDPLGGAENKTENSKHYKVDDVIFAEPMTIFTTEELSKIGESENIRNQGTTIDKGTVLSGKINNCHIDSSHCVCTEDNCKEQFSSITLLEAHTRKVHCMDRKFICEQCGIWFKAHYLLMRHTAVHDKKKIKCTVCLKMLSKRTGLHEHMRTHTNVRAHECPVCRRRFGRASTLATHVRFLHADREKALKCHKCNMRFDSRTELSRHPTSSCLKTKKIP